MTNHNSAANAIRSVRKKIECYSSPDGTPLSTNTVPKRRGKAAKAANGDDSNAKKKKASKKKADAISTNGDDSGTVNGGSEDAVSQGDGNSDASNSPKRKNATEGNGSPKKRVRETKVKSEKTVKEEVLTDGRSKTVVILLKGSALFNTFPML